MFWWGIVVFGAQGLVAFADELFFHRKREVTRAERLWSALELAILIALGALVLSRPYLPSLRLAFVGAALVSLLMAASIEARFASSRSAAEAFTHAFRLMLQPMALLVLALIWPFVRGTSLVAGIVLPFSTKGVFPLVAGYTAFLGLFFLWTILRALLPARRTALA